MAVVAAAADEHYDDCIWPVNYLTTSPVCWRDGWRKHTRWRRRGCGGRRSKRDWALVHCIRYRCGLADGVGCLLLFIWLLPEDGMSRLIFKFQTINRGLERDLDGRYSMDLCLISVYFCLFVRPANGGGHTKKKIRNFLCLIFVFFVVLYE